MNTHTEVLAQGDPNTPVCAEPEPRGCSLESEVTTDRAAEHKHAVPHVQSSRLALMLPFPF